MHKDEFGQRMKSYELNDKLEHKKPVIARIDGKCFHSFTKKLEKPFDDVLINTMQDVMLYLCQNIQGCVFGYTQSDEISLILCDYFNEDTSPYFDYKIQKCASVIASMATMYFNRIFISNSINYLNTLNLSGTELFEKLKIYSECKDSAVFDCRVFNLPVEEVSNYMYWRQLDAIRNSVQMVGRTYFSNKSLKNKNCNEIKNMLLNKGVDWNILPTYKKRGACCVKNEIVRKKWFIDKTIPIFKDNREYIENNI